MNEMSDQVTTAVDTVREHFAGHVVEVTPDGGGGAYVVVRDVEVGVHYTPVTTWLGFQMNNAYPRSDVYPHYVGVVACTDGRGHGVGVQAVSWRNEPALQLSRRSNRWNLAYDNAALKAEKVLTWFAGL